MFDFHDRNSSKCRSLFCFCYTCLLNPPQRFQRVILSFKHYFVYQIKLGIMHLKSFSAICATVSSPPGGTVSLQSDGAETMAYYTCNLGYSMEGKSLLKCRSDGSWDVTSPSCSSYITLLHHS